MADDYAATNDDFNVGGGEDESGSNMSPLASTYYAIALVIISSISFWVQSVVTEERLVPALNIISEYFKIPDDIAGATLMAAGASSPELLCTIISLFITHSSLGLGTIVGSEIFNQLIICAGSVYSSKVHSNDDENVAKYGERYLVLDKTMVIREVGFYALSIGLLWISLSEIVWDADDRVDRVNVSLWKAALLFGGYVLYVFVCSNMERISNIPRLFRRVFLIDDPQQEQGPDFPEELVISSSNYELYKNNPEALRSLESVMSFDSVRCRNFDEEALYKFPFIYNLTNEPKQNMGAGETIVITNNSNESNLNDSISESSSVEKSGKNSNKSGWKRFTSSGFKLFTPNHFIRARNHYPIECNEVLELANDENNCELRCHLWERSYFYSKARARAQAFHLRWFTITPQRISSVPDRDSPTKHVMIYPLFDEMHVDVDRLIIQLVNPVEGKRDFILIAPTRTIFDAVLHAFDYYVTETSSLRDRGLTELDDDPGSGLSKRDRNADGHTELIEPPKNASILELALWGMLFPLRVIMHYTLPDVRRLDHQGLPTASIWLAYLSTITSLSWLLVGSYVMVVSLETLAEVIGIPDAIMGVTLSAAGTSLPAYIASRIAAERGFGNQAVANIFGSNTFNICIGLGLPWLIYCLVNDGSYTELENEHILESILTMAGALLLFVVLMIKTNYVVLKWHADLYVLLYILYVGYSIGRGFFVALET